MGVLSRLKNLFFKLLDFLASMDIDVVDEGTDSDGNRFQVCQRTINGKVYKYRRTTVVDKDDENKITLFYESKNPKAGMQKANLSANISPEEIAKYDKEFFIKQLKVSEEDFDKSEDSGTETGGETPATASKNIKVTLKKIQSSENTDSIQLNRFCANYDIPVAMDDLTVVLDSPDFVDTLTEEPQSFLITSGDEDFDVVPTDDEFGVDSQYQIIMLAALTLLSNIQAIHWKAAGEDFFQLHEKLDEYIQDCRDQVDAIAELSMECTGDVTDPVSLIICHADKSNEYVPIGNYYDINDGFAIVQSNIDKYVETLEAYYPNFAHDIQSELDTWIRKWKKVSRYFLTRQQMIK